MHWLALSLVDQKATIGGVRGSAARPDVLR